MFAIATFLGMACIALLRLVDMDKLRYGLSYLRSENTYFLAITLTGSPPTISGTRTVFGSK